MAPTPKRKTARAPAVDKLMRPVSAVVVVLLAYFVYQGIQAEIPRVDVSDGIVLREVLFGEGEGKDYAVLCHDETSNIPVSSVFQDAKSDTSVPAEFVLMNCNHILPESGKSIAERFSLNTKKRPTIFVSGKQNPPKQIPAKHLKTGNMLVKALKYSLEPRTEKIENTKQLKQKCLDKEYCALFLKGGTPDKKIKKTMQDLIVTYPKVQFASIDSSLLLLTNLEDVLPMYSKGKHRFLMFKKVSGGTQPEQPKKSNDEEEEEEEGEETPKKEDTKKSTRLITSVSGFGASRSMSYTNLSSTIAELTNGVLKPKRIPALPQVKTRTKKLEEQERQKRDRIKNRSKNAGSSQQKQQQQSSSGAFEDGSKEARKAERDRRRAEHHKEQNIKPKTPEEIAEMERKRRLRMEEEASKWNMMEEDAPEEGEPVMDEEFDIGMEDVEDGEFVDIDEEEEEEDIMDLD